MASQGLLNATRSMNNASYEYQLQHWDEDGSFLLYLSALINIAMVLVSFPLYSFGQSLIGQRFKADFWFFLVASAFALATAITQGIAVLHGEGKHEIRVMVEDPDPPTNVVLTIMASVLVSKVKNVTLTAGQLGYFLTIFQALSLTCTKLGLLHFYSRVFAPNRATPFKGFQWVVKGMYFYCCALGIGWLVLFIFPCNPPNLYWIRIYEYVGYDMPDSTDGKCFNELQYLVPPLLLDLISETALIVIPALAIVKLQLTVRKKAGLVCVFSLGVLVLGVSIARFVMAIKMSKTLPYDITYVLEPYVYAWTSVQACWGVFVACLPGWFPAVRKIGPSFKRLFNGGKPDVPDPSDRSAATPASRPRHRPLIVQTEEPSVESFNKGKPEASTACLSAPHTPSRPRHRPLIIQMEEPSVEQHDDHDSSVRTQTKVSIFDPELGLQNKGHSKVSRAATKCEDGAIELTNLDPRRPVRMAGTRAPTKEEACPFDPEPDMVNQGPSKVKVAAAKSKDAKSKDSKSKDSKSKGSKPKDSKSNDGKSKDNKSKDGVIESAKLDPLRPVRMAGTRAPTKEEVCPFE